MSILVLNNIHHMLRLRHIYFIVSFLVCALVTGCVERGQAAGSAGPAEILLKIDARQTKSAEDYYGIHSIRVYAYKSGSTDEKAVGYAYFPNIDRPGPYLCPIQIGDETSGMQFPCDLDFVVIINDDCIYPEAALDESTVLGAIDSRTFSTLAPYSGTAFVPMCNERVTGGAVNSNNFSFTVYGETGRTQIIPIDVKRCISRLTLSLKKNGESTITVTGVTLEKGPKEAPLALKTDLINGTSEYFAENEDGSSVILSDTDVILSDGEQTIAEASILPNPYGSENADTYIREDNSSYDDSGKTYRLNIDYTIERDGITVQKAKTVYFPSVPANSHINVSGTISDMIQDVAFNVTVMSWVEHTIDVPAFE